MNAAIFSFTKPTPDTTVAGNRIATFISEQLDIPLICDANISQSWDVLIIINGIFTFSKYLNEVAAAVNQSQRLIWIQNDYTVLHPVELGGDAQSPFRLAFRSRLKAGKIKLDYWTTVKVNARATALSRYVNWNALTWEPERRAMPETTGDDLFYYGAYRANREDSFNRYFRASTDVALPVTISSTSKKFAEKFRTSPKIIFAPGMARSEFYAELAKHGMGLYIEDKRSSVEYHSPANRFYEMLGAGLPMVFQPEAQTMLGLAGFDVADFTAYNPKAVTKLMEKRDLILQEQQARWASVDYKADLVKRVKEVWDEYRRTI